MHPLPLSSCARRIARATISTEGKRCTIFNWCFLFGFMSSQLSDVKFDFLFSPTPTRGETPGTPYSSAGARGRGRGTSSRPAWAIRRGGTRFVLGTSSGPPTAAGAQAQSAGAAERVLLTISEQRACQALRVAADRQKLEALCAEAGSYAPGGVKSFKRREAELRRHPPLMDQEQALADLDAELRQEGERRGVRRRRDGQGLAELTWVLDGSFYH